MAMAAMAAMVALMESGLIHSLAPARIAMGRQGGGKVDAAERVLSAIRGRGMLMLFLLFLLFLLDTGIAAARQIRAFKDVGLFMAVFGVCMPLVNGVIGISLGHGHRSHPVAGLDGVTV